MADELEKLIDDVSQGDVVALESVIARHLDGLAGFVRARAPDLLAREADVDLLQSACREVLEDVREGRFRYAGEAAFKQWLYQAALLKIRDRRRYWAADKRGGGRAEERFLVTSTSGDPRQLEFLESVCSPSGAVVRKEEIEIASTAFARLDEVWRKIIVLARIEGLSHQEIAAQLKPPLTTVRFDRREYGRQAAQLVKERLAETTRPPRVVRMPVAIVERESVK